MKKLIFVYNGDSGLINGMLHYLHKRISPKTYPCQLCGIIYDGLSMKQEWLDFVKSLGVATEFLHRDEYAQRYGERTQDWPAVLLHDDQQFVKTAISAQAFTRIEALQDLQQKLRSLVDQEFAKPAPERSRV